MSEPTPQEVLARWGEFHNTPGKVIASAAFDETYTALSALEKQTAADRAALAEATDIERLAALEHKQWCEWATHLMASETLSRERITRWVRLIRPYGELSETEKEQDRIWARKVAALAAGGGAS